jgi:glycosyltransferase involved in cell wall biosynthesis
VYKRALAERQNEWGFRVSVRVIIEQPALAQYRVPVFRELARRPGLDLRVHYGANGKVPNAAADGFLATPVRSRYIPFGPREAVWNASCWRTAATRSADVLMLTWNLHHLNLVPALLRARANGIATVLWGHGYSKDDVAWRRLAREQAARLATALLFYNDRAKDGFIAGGWSPERLHVALNTIDQQPVQAARSAWLHEPDRLAAFRSKQGIDGRPVLLFVSRLQPENRVDLLLRASALLRQKHAGLKTVIIGKGPASDMLRRLARALGIDDAVIFPGAIYDEMRLAPWFLSATALCYPENIGLTLLHAFGYGVPVVTSAALDRQNPEIDALEHERNGLLYEHANVPAMVEALDAIIAHPHLAAAMSERARATALQRFTLGQMVNGVEGAIHYAREKLIGGEPFRRAA